MLLNLENLKIKYNLDMRGVVHIGAHHGQEYSTYKKINIKKIVFFEPLKSNFKKLCENVDNKCILINKALGNFKGHVEMFVESVNLGQSSSILEPDIHLKQYPHIKFDQKEIVEITELDEYFDNHKDCNFINIDVQGYELEVFKGAKKFLSVVDYIMTEVNNDEVYKNCVKVDELDKFLSDYGFQRVETTWDGKTWGDAFYIKKNEVNF